MTGNRTKYENEWIWLRFASDKGSQSFEYCGLSAETWEFNVRPSSIGILFCTFIFAHLYYTNFKGPNCYMNRYMYITQHKMATGFKISDTYVYLNLTNYCCLYNLPVIYCYCRY